MSRRVLLTKQKLTCSFEMHKFVIDKLLLFSNIFYNVIPFFFRIMLMIVSLTAAEPDGRKIIKVVKIRPKVGSNEEQEKQNREAKEILIPKFGQRIRPKLKDNNLLSLKRLSQKKSEDLTSTHSTTVSFSTITSKTLEPVTSEKTSSLPPEQPLSSVTFTIPNSTKLLKPVDEAHSLEQLEKLVELSQSTSIAPTAQPRKTSRKNKKKSRKNKKVKSEKVQITPIIHQKIDEDKEVDLKDKELVTEIQKELTSGQLDQTGLQPKAIGESINKNEENPKPLNQNSTYSHQEEGEPRLSHQILVFEKPPESFSLSSDNTQPANNLETIFGDDNGHETLHHPVSDSQITANNLTTAINSVTPTSVLLYQTDGDISETEYLIYTTKAFTVGTQAPSQTLLDFQAIEIGSNLKHQTELATTNTQNAVSQLSSTTESVILQSLLASTTEKNIPVFFESFSEEPHGAVVELETAIENKIDEARTTQKAPSAVLASTTAFDPLSNDIRPITGIGNHQNEKPLDLNLLAAKFSCQGRIEGYYADVNSECKVKFNVK